MNDDDLLKQLGAAARAERDEDPRWERYALGTATESERAALEALEGDESERKRAAYRPLADAVLDRMAARATPVRPIRGPASWFRRAVAVAGPLAIAAGVALYIATPTATPLARYDVSTSGGEQALRAPSTAGTSVHVGSHASRVELLLRPATRESEVEAHAFAVRGDDVEPWEATSEYSAEGTARITGSSAALRDASEIRVVVGHPRALGDAGTQLARARGGSASGKGWQVIAVPIVAGD
jgi:hypothetical protein